MLGEVEAYGGEPSRSGSRDAAPARIDRTWDNGTGSSCHLLVDEALGMLTYYADPYSPYQRGTNENRNGRIRRYLPKRTSFDDLSDETCRPSSRRSTTPR